MTDEDPLLADLTRRYRKTLHGVQSAIAYAIDRGDGYAATEPKHLRVGIDSAHVSNLALANLLIAKGVFTNIEYVGALLGAAEAELADWELRFAPLKFG